MKLLYAGHVKKLGEFAMALEGAEGMLSRDDAPEQGAWQQQFLNAPAIRIAGGSDDIYLDEDGWTIRTADGSRAAHAEHTIAVTADGPVILTAP